MIERWRAGSDGRSRAVAFGSLVWVVANGDESEPFERQLAGSFARVDRSLEEAGSDRGRLLSVQIVLSDLRRKADLDRAWNDWIGGDATRWPQRSCIQAGLTGGLQVEIVAVAAREPR
ncbi:MAG: Rid family hydrolase [Acidobacteriota bacterium]